MNDLVYEADLTIGSGVAEGRCISISAVLEAGERIFIIGSDPHAHLQIAGTEVAHAGMRRRANSYFIQPRLPEFAVYVNGKRISGPTCLLPGDKIMIGGVRLLFDQREGVPFPPTEPPHPKSLLRKLETEGPSAPTPAPRSQPLPEPVLIAAPGGKDSRPKRKHETSLTGMIFGAVTLVLIVVAVMWAIVESFHLDEPFEPRPINPASQAGQATLIMFDADW